MTDRSSLRGVFDEDAELYDRVRPGYPGVVFDDLTAVAGLRPGARVLEIGCGTGQATVPLAARGFRVTAVELGPSMAAVARRRLAASPGAEVVVSAFEDWPLPDEPFDAVVAATAFHWIDPAVAVVKCAEALRPGGVLAVIATHHVDGGSRDFFADVQECYERFTPERPPRPRPSAAALVPADSGETDRSGCFGPAVFHRYERELPYTTDEYLDLLLSYSNHRALPAVLREGLLACVRALIDGRYGGRVVKRYLTELRITRRL
ncbi:class I SAM-dependent methyltransferase [Actinacidiphila sp. bgisy167]|uniref:class I SAM-dependent methyltransferase n=1 Tax=Actinacidiphila sp. bgisy167 TaxID=3413797 RepID=UPI003D760319